MNTSEEEKTLSQLLLDQFEDLFLAVLGRVSQPETSVKLKLKNQLSLEKAHSVIDDNASDNLLQ